MMKRTLLAALAVAIFSISNAAFAGCPDGKGNKAYVTPSQADNIDCLDKGIAFLEQAIAAAQAGDQAETVKLSQAAYDKVIEINSETWAGPLEGAKGKIRVGKAKAKKGQLAKALKYWTDGPRSSLPILQSLYGHSNKTHSTPFNTK